MFIIQRKKQGINTELDRLANEKRQLEENIEDLKKGLGFKKQQYTHEHSQAHRLNHQIKSFKKDLQDAVAYFQDPVLLKVNMTSRQHYLART